MAKSDEHELKCVKILAEFIDNKYYLYEHNGKKDNFDFTNNKIDSSLEITKSIPNEEIEAIQYNDAINKGKNPDKSRIKEGTFDNNGVLETYYGSAQGALKRLKSAILKKQSKLLRRQKFNHNELCVDFEDGGLYRASEIISCVVKILDQVDFETVYIIHYNEVYKITKNNNEVFMIKT